MRSCFITLRSVTFGQKAQRVLERAGIHGVLQRTPRWMEEQGCGYCIKLKGTDCAKAAQVLQSQQVPFRKIYRQDETGIAEVEL